MNIEVITKPYQVINMVEKIKTARLLGVDTETTGLDPYTYHPLLISLYANDTAYVLDLTKLGKDATKHLKSVLEDPNIKKIGHNLTYEYKFFYHTARIEMQNMHDVMVVERLIRAGLRLKHTLKDVTMRRLNIDMDKTIRKTFIGMDIQDVSFTEEQYQYSAMDAVYPVDMYGLQMQEIDKLSLRRIYNLEMSILAPTAMMEYTGITVDRDMLVAMIAPFEHFVGLADKALQDMIIMNGGADQIVFSRNGYSALNTASDDQMKQVLLRMGIKIEYKGKLSLDSKAVQRWDMLQRKKKGKTYKGFDVDYHQLVEDEEVANALDAYIGIDHPVLRAFTFLQGARKLLSTYIHGIINAINPITGKVHPFFNTLGAEATGRYSSNGPNFQNLPKDDKMRVLGLGAYSLRKCIKANKGRKLIIADYAGIELVILAVNAKAHSLLDKILRGDIHTDVTINVLGYKEITKQNKKQFPHVKWRDGSKTMSYSIAYGTTGKNVAETLNIILAEFGFKIDAKEGDKLIEAWFNMFPEVKAYLHKNAKQAIDKCYVTDVWGRRRNWNERWFMNIWKRHAAEREGQNAPVQGTSATMTKLAIALLWAALDRKRARIVITVHDEIVVEATEAYAETAAQLTKECMEQAIRETLPDVADIVGLYEGTSVAVHISDCYDK